MGQEQQIQVKKRKSEPELDFNAANTFDVVKDSGKFPELIAKSWPEVCD